MAFEEKNNPPLWFIVAGVIIISIATVLVILAPTVKYTPDNQYYLKNAQSSIMQLNSTAQKNIS